MFRKVIFTLPIIFLFLFISPKAFAAELVLPGDVQQIEDKAFYGDTSLEVLKNEEKSSDLRHNSGTGTLHGYGIELRCIRRDL